MSLKYKASLNSKLNLCFYNNLRHHKKNKKMILN